MIPAIGTVGQWTRKTSVGTTARRAMIQLISALFLPLDFVKKMIRAPVITPALPLGMATVAVNKKLTYCNMYTCSILQCTCTYMQELSECTYMYVYVLCIWYVSRKSVRKVSNGREITFEVHVLRGAREMYM